MNNINFAPNFVPYHTATTPPLPALPQFPFLPFYITYYYYSSMPLPATLLLLPTSWFYLSLVYGTWKWVFGFWEVLLGG